MNFFAIAKPGSVGKERKMKDPLPSPRVGNRCVEFSRTATDEEAHFLSPGAGQTGALLPHICCSLSKRPPGCLRAARHRDGGTHIDTTTEKCWKRTAAVCGWPCASTTSRSGSAGAGVLGSFSAFGHSGVLRLVFRTQPQSGGCVKTRQRRPDREIPDLPIRPLAAMIGRQNPNHHPQKKKT